MKRNMENMRMRKLWQSIGKQATSASHGYCPICRSFQGIVAERYYNLGGTIRQYLAYDCKVCGRITEEFHRETFACDKVTDDSWRKLAALLRRVNHSNQQWIQQNYPLFHLHRKIVIAVERNGK